MSNSKGRSAAVRFALFSGQVVVASYDILWIIRATLSARLCLELRRELFALSTGNDASVGEALRMLWRCLACGINEVVTTLAANPWWAGAHAIVLVITIFDIRQTLREKRRRPFK